LAVEPDLSERKVAALIRDSGRKVGSEALRAALRAYRQQVSESEMGDFLL
jgi:hypothetical protein